MEGLSRLSLRELGRLLAPCLGEPDPGRRLSACAARLTARLVADGYINSRVYPQPEPAPQGTLLVVEGRIVEVRVRSADARLQRRLQRIALTLQGQVLHLPSLKRSLDQLEQLPGVGAVSTSLNRLGGDVAKASLVIEADPAPRRFEGDLSLRNDGSTGSGQFRALGVLAKDSFVLPDDDLLLVGELNADADPELGYSLASLSYGLPLGDQLRFTTALASSWRTMVERPPPLHSLTYQESQVLGELEATLWEGLASRVKLFAGLSASRNRSERNGRRYPGVFGGAGQGRLTSGYARTGMDFATSVGAATVEGSLFGMQGIAAFSGDAALRELDRFGIRVSAARAVAADLDIGWAPAPGWLLELRGAGQLALSPLLDSMGFSLGSDSGLRGLPGQVTSGDSGLLGYGELSWQMWSQGRQELQLVPFLGAGWVTTTVKGDTSDRSVGAGGVLLRWLQGSHWLLELGWASQFGRSPRDANPNWLIDNGLYTKVSYSF